MMCLAVESPESPPPMMAIFLGWVGRGRFLSSARDWSASLYGLEVCSRLGRGMSFSAVDEVNVGDMDLDPVMAVVLVVVTWKQWVGAIVRAKMRNGI